MAQSGYDFRGMQPQGATDNWTFTPGTWQGGGGEGTDPGGMTPTTWTNTRTGETATGETPPGWSVYSTGKASFGAVQGSILQSPDGQLYSQPGGGMMFTPGGVLQPLSLTPAQADQIRSADNQSNAAYQGANSFWDNAGPGILNSAAFIGAGMGLNALTGAGSLGTAGTMSGGLGDLAAYESAAGGAATGGLEGTLGGASGLAGSGITDEMLLTGMAPEAGGTAAGTVADGFSGAGAGLFGSGVPGGSWLTGSLGGAGTAATGTAATGATGAGSAAASLSSILSNGGSVDDWLKLAGAAAPGLIGAYAANQQTGAIKDIANQQKDQFNQFASYGAPYRQRLSDLYADPNSFLTSDTVQKPVQQGTDMLARSLSVNGNPMGSGNGLQQLQNYSADQLFGRLGQEKDRLAGFGGLSAYNQAAASAPAAQTSLGLAGINSGANTWNALGASANNIFNPQKSLAEQLAALGWRS